MDITEETLALATRVLHDFDCDPKCGESLTTMGRYGRQAKAILEAVAPLIAAQALRDLADEIETAGGEEWDFLRVIPATTRMLRGKAEQIAESDTP